MRASSSLRFVVLAASLVSTCLARAQFQEPTQDELKMTSDPKAPGAAAVYLNREERSDDDVHFASVYGRLKVLTEKGKEAATIRVHYDPTVYKVAGIRGRTIHADGTVVPLMAKPSDLLVQKSKDGQVNELVFTLPNVEVGSVLEFYLQERYDEHWIGSPEWDIQQTYFVHKAKYFFQPSHTTAEGLLYVTHVRPDTKLVRDTLGRFTYEIADVAALPDEDWMPPVNSLAWRIEFYYSDVRGASDFWKGAGAKWAKDADRFAEPTAALRAAVGGLVSAADTDEQKARKLYDAVQQLENADFTRKKTASEQKAEGLKATRNAETAWVQKSGSANELALVYLALLRAAGLKAYAMQVVNRDRAAFDTAMLDASQVDDYLVAVNLGGKDVMLDPGEKLCPFGLLHWKHTVATGLREVEKGTQIATTPASAYTQNTTQRIADLQLAENGGVTGSIRVVMSGQEALRWRQLTLAKDAAAVKGAFNEWIGQMTPEGVQVDFDHFLALDDIGANLVGVVNVSGTLGSGTAKRMFVPGLFFESRGKHPFTAQDKREIPVDVHFPERVTDDVTLTLPGGFTVESAPQSTTIPWPGAASLKIKTTQEGSDLTVERTLLYNFTLLKPAEYGTLHDFYVKVASADQQQIVLSRGPQAAK